MLITSIPRVIRKELRGPRFPVFAKTTPRPRCMETAKVMEAHKMTITEMSPERPGREELKKALMSPLISKVSRKKPVLKMISATLWGEDSNARETKNETIKRAGANESRKP
jgi:hypothetical protein